jgi:hypothetical protein
MAAIDPSAEVKNAEGITQRATLKIVREPLSMDDDDDDDDDEYMRMIGGGSDSEEDEEESDDEEVNGGPSDPAKSKKARKAAAVQQLIESLKQDSDDEKEAANGVNGEAKVNKGKAKATSDDEDEDEDEDMEDGSEDGFDLLEETVLCTLDPERVSRPSLAGSNFTINALLTSRSTTNKLSISLLLRTRRYSSKSLVHTPFISPATMSFHKTMSITITTKSMIPMRTPRRKMTRITICRRMRMSSS